MYGTFLGGVLTAAGGCTVEEYFLAGTEGGGFCALAASMYLEDCVNRRAFMLGGMRLARMIQHEEEGRLWLPSLR
ncbi:hypothetical protein XPA_005971 [Xanthoria parietina]